MLHHLVVEVDSTGTAVVFVPMFELWELLQHLPRFLPAISYDGLTQQAKVSFPGLRPPLAQMIVDAALLNVGNPCEVHEPVWRAGK